MCFSARRTPSAMFHMKPAHPDPRFRRSPALRQRASPPPLSLPLCHFASCHFASCASSPLRLSASPLRFASPLRLSASPLLLRLCCFASAAREGARRRGPGERRLRGPRRARARRMRARRARTRRRRTGEGRRGEERGRGEWLIRSAQPPSPSHETHRPHRSSLADHPCPLYSRASSSCRPAVHPRPVCPRTVPRTARAPCPTCPPTTGQAA